MSAPERIARIYDARASIPYDPDSDTAYILDDVRLVEEVAGTPSRLLDAGCGLGWHIDKFVERGFPLVVGVDLSAGSVEAARTRLSGQKRSGWSLVCEDLSTHRPAIPYTAVASFLSCLGSFGDAGDLALLKGLRRSLADGSAFVMTSFYREGVDALVGDFVTQYARGSRVKLHTRARFDGETSEIVFSQQIERSEQASACTVEEERIRLYSAHQMGELLRAAGFRSVATFPECAIDGARRSVDRSGVMLTIARV